MLITNKYPDSAEPVNPSDGASARSEGMAGLAKGLAILEAFGSQHASLSISEAAGLTGVSRAAARRCLQQLVELGYLVARGRQFAPSPRVLRLGAAYLSAAPLPELARPLLAEARDALGESISLTLFDDGFAVFVARAEAERVVSTGFRLGVRAPAWNTAAGRVLLGALSDEELTAYLDRADIRGRTARTVTDRTRLAEIVREANRLGFSINDEEIEVGMRSLAVPIRDARSTIVAAISTSTFVARTSQAELEAHFLPVLRDVAARIERLL
jgi:IclR family pca regulon transcriptional regulator